MTQPIPNAEEVFSTIGYDGFVKALYNRTGDLSKDFTHAVLGLVTESHEYLTATDQINAVEEAGDLAFYRVALQQVLEDLATSNEVEQEKVFAEALERMSGVEINILDLHMEWLDLAKRWIGYGKSPTMSTSELLGEVDALLTITIALGDAADSDPYDVIYANVNKLLKRYNGTTFNADRAVNRDLVAERAALEITGA